MLRITIHDDPAVTTFQLEGRLAGSWVQELQDCWQSALAASPRSAVRFDLSEVSYIDAAGKKFLAARHAQGAELFATGCLMRAIVWEITHASTRGQV